MRGSKWQIRAVLADGISYAAILAMLAFFLFPVLYMMLISVRPVVDMTSLWSNHFTLNAYKEIFSRYNFGVYLWNSVLVSLGTVSLLLAFGLLTAYIISRFNMTRTLLGIMIFRAAPPVGFLLPFFLMFNWLRLLDTHASLIISHFVRLLPLFIWLMVGYFREIPRELDEAAMVDGCSRAQALFRVLLPSVTPGLVATTIISFILSWNDLLYALVLTGVKNKTLPVAVNGLLGYASTSWDLLTAGATIATIPVLVFGVLIQKYLVRGLTAGAVKG
ncbi:MAG: carbohydrate ABC transporter permease [Bacteroidota bacterium]